MKIIDKKIVMPAGGVKMLMQACSVGQAAVYNALSYKSNSEQAKRIRSRAIAEFGGKRINKSVEAVL